MHRPAWCFVVIGLVASPLSPHTGAGEPDRLEVCADSLVRSFRASHGIPAVASAVMHEGVVVYNRAVGSAHLELDVPTTPSTLFQLSSTAKVLTGVLAMALVEQGRLDLDAPVTRYLSDAPPGWQALTVRHGLTHTSGLPAMADLGGALSGDLSATEVMNELYRRAPAPRPGQAFAYDVAGYFVAQRAMERAAGKDFVSLMRSEVMERAGMTAATYWSSSLEVIEGAATDYYPDDADELRQRDFVFPPHFFAAGGLAASSEDLLRFGRALSSGRLIAPSSVDEMWSSVELNDGSTVTYGLGWDTKSHAPGQPSAGHSGGRLTTLRVYPESGLTVILLTNGYRRPFNPDDFATALAAIWDPAIVGLAGPPCEIRELEGATF